MPREVPVSVLLDALADKRVIGTPPGSVTGLTADSRRVARGDVFVAVPGFKPDARRFVPAAQTTPEALEIEAMLAAMRARGVRGVAMEVSSHALALSRVDALAFDVGVFTNLTQDHLDFHGTLDE